MRVASFAVLALAQSALAAKVLIGNDDGFKTAGIIALYRAVKGAGHDALIAAPVMQQSGTDGSMKDPVPLQEDGEFGFVKKGAPAEGHDEDDDHIWYINSTPASSIKYGLDVLAPRYFGGAPDIVLTGVNQGNNLGLAYLVSGTYGAAKYAVKQGLPAIALSSENATVRPFTEISGPEDQANVYAGLSVQLLEQVLKSKPYLPVGTGLNVNVPSAVTRGCNTSNSRWIMTRLLGNIQRDPDACTCGQVPGLRKGCKLPVERTVLDKNMGCTNSISVFAPTTFSPDASKEEQAVVIKSLEGFTTCLS